MALLRDEAVRYNISVRTELAMDLPRVVGDRVQLQQVAMNLIVNGIEAMKGVDGTREVIIRSQRAEEDQIQISVSDTGVGFPPQLAEQIFEPFFTTKPEGTGMGLRICRSIIEAHGGRSVGASVPLGKEQLFTLACQLLATFRNFDRQSKCSASDTLPGQSVGCRTWRSVSICQARSALGC